MTLKNIAATGMTVTVDQSTVTPSGATVYATIIPVATAITKVAAEGKLVHVDGDTITVTAITAIGPGMIPIASVPDAGPYTPALNATATKVRAEGTLVLRLDDLSDTVSATPQIPGSPPVDYPVTFKCKITNAAQAKVKAQ